MSGDVDDVIESSDDHAVAVLVEVGTVSREVPSLFSEFFPVDFFEAVVVSVECSQHGGPGSLEDEESAVALFDVIAFFGDDGGFDAEER